MTNNPLVMILAGFLNKYSLFTGDSGIHRCNKNTKVSVDCPNNNISQTAAEGSPWKRLLEIKDVHVLLTGVPVASPRGSETLLLTRKA